MTTIEQIEKAVEHLSPEELAQFRSWFEGFPFARWDDEIARDSAAGLFGRLIETARSEKARRETREL